MYRQLGDTTLVLPSSVRGLTYLADRHCQFVIATRRSGRSFCISAINNHGKTIAVNAKGCSKSAVGDYKLAICQPCQGDKWSRPGPPGKEDSTSGVVSRERRRSRQAGRTSCAKRLTFKISGSRISNAGIVQSQISDLHYFCFAAPSMSACVSNPEQLS